MPPWYIEKDIGIQKYKDDPSLSDAEITKIAKWADSGAPRGNPSDMPPPRQYVDDAAWRIGTPGLSYAGVPACSPGNPRSVDDEEEWTPSHRARWAAGGVRI